MKLYPSLTGIQDIPITWEYFINYGDAVIRDKLFRTMRIKTTSPSTVSLTNDPDSFWKKGEYRNAFVLSQALEIPTDERILVVTGQVFLEYVQGTTGLWLHATGIFNDSGEMVKQGFVGGAAGFSWIGTLSFPLLRGWTYQQAEGWKPNLRCFGKARIENGDFVTLRVTKNVTTFIVNGTVIKHVKTNIATPSVVLQLWLDNDAIGPLFQVRVGKVTNNQKSMFTYLHAYYAISNPQ